MATTPFVLPETPPYDTIIHYKDVYFIALGMSNLGKLETPGDFVAVIRAENKQEMWFGNLLSYGIRKNKGQKKQD